MALDHCYQNLGEAMQIPIKTFTLTVALFSGVSFFIISWWGIALGHGGESIPGLFGQLYLGYDYSFKGSLIGFLWGFFDWGIAGAIFAWLYNRIAKKMGES